nr:hypothetical protein FFPRI1PSEUD_46050 [Pseudomonas sp. FFPRI_1]
MIAEHHRIKPGNAFHRGVLVLKARRRCVHDLKVERLGGGKPTELESRDFTVPLAFFPVISLMDSTGGQRKHRAKQVLDAQAWLLNVNEHAFDLIKRSRDTGIKPAPCIDRRGIAALV